MHVTAMPCLPDFSRVIFLQLLPSLSSVKSISVIVAVSEFVSFHDELLSSQ
jgi:hypothetical protein